jgi:hypothetical protein
MLSLSVIFRKAQTKVLAAQRVKKEKEVEQNPFKKLLDIRDLLSLESIIPNLNVFDVVKEIENIMLRHNSELKLWYKKYSRGFERIKMEESFSMTIKQLWRFLRDCQVPSYNATLADFNRIFLQVCFFFSQFNSFSGA